MQRRTRRTLLDCAAVALALSIAVPAGAQTEPAATAVAQHDEHEPSYDERPDNGPGPREVDMPSEERQIRNMIETRYPGFVRAGDAEGYAGQFTEDALWMPPGEADRKGPKEIAATLGAELEAVELRPVITVREVSIAGDHAWVVGEDDITVLPRDGGEEARVVYTVFWLLRRVGEEWKIARQIWNEKPTG